MCGIHLIVQKSKAGDENSGPILRMIESLEHRGPDGSGNLHLNWGDEQVWIGHNLLAISADVKNARQPLVSEDGITGIVFNGQIYNHSELRNLLEKDGIFVKNPSDTAVLLAWIQVHGRKGLRKLEGMYAFVFWDSLKKLLIIHRDGYGIKPLFLARTRHTMAVSSEPYALFASGLFQFSIDKKAISYYLKYKFIPPNYSPWTGLKLIPPGEVIEYWEGKPMHFQVHSERLHPKGISGRQALDKGFSAVIPANEPIGLLFSGGLDSTLILTWCLQNGISIKPFSIRFQGFGNQHFDDQESARYLAEKLGVEVEWVDVGMEDLANLLSFPNGKLPIVADSAWWLTNLLAQRAKEFGIRILLSGAGADEWFGGYRRHWYYHQWQKINPYFPDRWQRPILQKLKMGNPLDKSGHSQRVSELVWDAAVSSRLSGFLKNQPSLYHTHQQKSNSALQESLHWDQREYLPNDVLAVSDFATMAHGIEGRFPYLHPSITNWAESFSAEERMEGGRKHLLLQFLSPDLNEYFRKKKKHGFGVPMEALLKSQIGKSWMNEQVLSQKEFFSNWFTEESWQEFLSKWSPEKMAQEGFALGWLSKWMERQNFL